MTNEELNTALYKKMFAEQEAYKDWLLEQSPQTILENAYDFVIREDILLSMESNDLSDEQAEALLQTEAPLEDIFRAYEKRESSHMEELWDCIQQRANDTITAQCVAAKEAFRTSPLYLHNAQYAKEHGEMEAYRVSFKANVACRDAIEEAVRDHYRDNRLDMAGVSQVIEAFGFDRTFHVLATTIRGKQWDGRISQEQKAWALTFPSSDPTDRALYYTVHRTHPGLLNLFTEQARKLDKEKKPSIHEQLQKQLDVSQKKPAIHKESSR